MIVSLEKDEDSVRIKPLRERISDARVLILSTAKSCLQLRQYMCQHPQEFKGGIDLQIYFKPEPTINDVPICVGRKEEASSTCIALIVIVTLAVIKRKYSAIVPYGESSIFAVMVFCTLFRPSFLKTQTNNKMSAKGYTVTILLEWDMRDIYHLLLK